MSAQTPVLVREAEAKVGYYVTEEATVTTNDTIKVKELSTIKRVLAMKFADWSTVTTTFTGNVITVTQAGLSSDRIVFIAGGLK